MAMKSGEVTIKRWKGHPTCRYRANDLIAGKLKRKGFRKKKPNKFRMPSNTLRI